MNSYLHKLFNTPVKELSDRELQYIVDIPDGITPGQCFCGCGQNTRIAKQDDIERGIIKGLPKRYIKNHNRRNSGKGYYIHSAGYVMVMAKGHPRSSKGFVMEHIIVMEKFLGRYVTNDESIHHIDGDKQNNDLSNLMLFDTEAAHQEYERHYRTFIACGHWNWIKCVYCHEYCSLSNVDMVRQGSGWAHRSCRSLYDSIRRSNNNENTSKTLREVLNVDRSNL